MSYLGYLRLWFLVLSLNFLKNLAGLYLFRKSLRHRLFKVQFWFHRPTFHHNQHWLLFFLNYSFLQ